MKEFFTRILIFLKECEKSYPHVLLPVPGTNARY
jgi:hypothetical protein